MLTSKIVKKESLIDKYITKNENLKCQGLLMITSEYLGLIERT